MTALSGGGPGGPADDAVVALRFADGSLASIGYGSAIPSGGRNGSRSTRATTGSSSTTSAASPRTARPYGRAVRTRGTAPWPAAFRQAVAGAGELPTEEMLATMRATIRAAAARGSHG